MLSYHLQQAKLMQSKHTEASCAGLAVLRQKYHTGELTLCISLMIHAHCDTHACIARVPSAAIHA